MPSSDHSTAQARRVISGVGENGKSTIVLDEQTTTRSVTDGFTVCDVWRVDSLPAHVDADDTLTGDVELVPPPEGLVIRVTTFPPDSAWEPSDVADSLGAMGGADAALADNDGIPGLHVLDTIDITTVLSGELYAVLEDSECLLKPGETFIQRGTKHAWSNRSDAPATVVAIMMAAKR